MLPVLPWHDWAICQRLSMPSTAQKPVIDIAEQRLLWDLACLAISLLKQDPAGLQGMLVAASHGPVHQAFQTRLAESFAITRVPVNVSEERLTGGLDINETLAQGKRVMQPGLLDMKSGAVLINGAERLETTVAGILAAHLDNVNTCATHHAVPIIALDESLPDETGLADTALGDRLALMLPLPNLPWQALQHAMAENELSARPVIEQTHAQASNQQPANAGDQLARHTAEAISRVEMPDDILTELSQLANALGIASMRPLIYASRVARGHAWLDGRAIVDMEDATVATRLVLAPRATQLPQESPSEAEPDAHQQADESSEPPDDDEATSDTLDAPDKPDDEDQLMPQDAQAPENADDTEPEETDQSADIAEQLLEAANATLPQHLIANLVRGQRAGNTSGRDSKSSSVGTQGRPAGVRRPRGRYARQRLNIVETLKSAAPRQRLRGRSLDDGTPGRLQIRLEDFRITRYKQPTRTTTVFVVDASGSAALHRLAEAKGAVELLLAECYVRRDRVAMISFRGLGASLELPPTRSLVRAKRQLSGLPGGGGTPLAAGLDLATDVVRQLKQAGETPVVVLMTDGKANINRRGEGSRVQALEDAEAAARVLASQDVRTLFIDTSPRPRPQAAQLAATMQARYLPLPPGGAAKLPGLLQ